jgi:tyrosine-protein kinase Etk/Wzc
MTRSNSVNSDLYMQLLQRQQETEIVRATTTSNVEIIDPAVLQKKPVRPNRPKAFLMATLIGLLTGIGCTFLLDYFDQTLRDIEGVREHLGLPVLATIPRIDLADESADLPSKQLALTLAPKSPAVEAFRSLRTALHFATTKKRGKVVMVTSSIPGEGKSTISGNLAGVLAQSGSKVLLIGCDLRRPSLSEMFAQNSVPGLTEMLIDRNMEALRKTGIGKLDFIPAGTVPPNPSELLGSKTMSQLIEQVRDRYDYIVLDAPPVLPVTDAQVLVNSVDMVAVVVEACRIQQKAAQRMLQTLRSVDAQIAGVILNDKTGTAARYYGSYNYYGHKKYGGYYGESTKELKPGFLQTVWEKLNS